MRRLRESKLRRVTVLTGLLAAVALSAIPARAQVVMIADAPVANESEQASNGFQILVDDSLATAFNDFQRYAERSDWEKAFRALGEIPPAKRTGMLRAPDGLIVPAGRRIWESIAKLPAEGREAFRVFYDARARNLWKQTLEPETTPQSRVETARRVYEEYFLTSVGDDAANFLGDTAFERGEFQDAERYWRVVLDHHPGSELGELKLTTKRALALLKLGKLKSFDALLRTLELRSDNRQVVLGGEPRDPVRFLADLRSQYAESADDTDAHSRPLLSGPLREDTVTAWRLRFLSDRGKEQLESAVSSNYYYRNGLETWIPPFAESDGKLFCNWFGIVFGVDVRTGKLLWRSDKFDTLHSRFSQMPHSNANLEQYAIAASGDTVVALWLNPERLNYYREPFRLKAYDAASGKEKWDSEKVESLKDQSFVGVPLIEGDNVLVTSHKRNESKLIIRSLKLADGTENWSKELGTAQQTSNHRGQQEMPLPRLLLTGNSLLILTNNGALLSFDSQRRETDWALKYGTTSTAHSGNRVFYSGDIDKATLLHSYGALYEQDGIVYAKETGSNEIHAVDPGGPTLLWSRPIAAESVLVGADQDYLYVLSHELMAIDHQTRKLAWSRRLPIEGGGLSAVISDETVYVCSRRGIYCLDRESGRLQQIFRGEELGAVGAWIGVVGDRVISISNTSITAYETSQTVTRRENPDEPGTGS